MAAGCRRVSPGSRRPSLGTAAPRTQNRHSFSRPSAPERWLSSRGLRRLRFSAEVPRHSADGRGRRRLNTAWAGDVPTPAQKHAPKPLDPGWQGSYSDGVSPCAGSAGFMLDDCTKYGADIIKFVSNVRNRTFVRYCFICLFADGFHFVNGAQTNEKDKKEYCFLWKTSSTLFSVFVGIQPHPFPGCCPRIVSAHNRRRQLQSGFSSLTFQPTEHTTWRFHTYRRLWK